MRAAVIHSLGEPPVAGDLPEPTRNEGQCLIEVRAAALNPLDLLVASGNFYGGTPEVPYAPGVEGVGIVVEGERFPQGTRVRFEGLSGGLAERVVSAEAGLMPVPDGIGDAAAAGLGVAGLAAWLSLEWRARLAPGEKVLVLGATGAVGRLAIQIAKMLGAGAVVAAARNTKALAELSADATVVLDDRGTTALAAEITEAAGGPVDVIVDTVWGEPAVTATAAAARGARLVNIGQIAGPVAALPSAALRGKLLSVLGHTNLLAPPELRATTFDRLARHVAQGDLILPHDVVDLTAVTEAWRRQQASPHRKLVVSFDRPGG
jgi:NADPH:quinone reductase-like Zn-dependent oxidoreductase